jgi:hypothetical protein
VYHNFHENLVFFPLNGVLSIILQNLATIFTFISRNFAKYEINFWCEISRNFVSRNFVSTLVFGFYTIINAIFVVINKNFNLFLLQKTTLHFLVCYWHAIKLYPQSQSISRWHKIREIIVFSPSGTCENYAVH